MQTVTKEELSARLGTPWLVVVNVLAPESYEKIHIRGSVSIPKQELEEGKWKELDFTKEIVVYCSSSECGASREAAGFLESKGFDVSAYEGGMKEWAESGLPTEGLLTPEQYLKEKYGESQKMEAAPAS
jgi:rhodanese-related sulfurtransferase